MTGEEIRAARQAKGLSFRGAAMRIGIHNSYLYELEIGRKSNPSPYVRRRIAQVLGLPVPPLDSPA